MNIGKTSKYNLREDETLVEVTNVCMIKVTKKVPG